MGLRQGKFASGSCQSTSFRQPDGIDDPLTELAREGARRMLAQALIAEADAFVAQWKGSKLPDDSLPARGVDRRLPGGARRPLGQGRAEPVASGDLAADGGMAGGLRCLAETRPVGAAIRVGVGGW